MPQRLSPRIRRKMAEMDANDARLKWISDYKKHYCHGQPNHKIKTDISTGQTYDGSDVTRSHQYVNKTGRLTKVIPPYISHLKRRTKSAPPVRYSVGDCLVWNPAPISAPTYRSTILTNDKPADYIPKPPILKRPKENLLSPRPPNYKATKNTEQMGMTPAATAISTFSPTSTNTQNFEATKSNNTSIDFTKPTIVVD